MASWIPEAEKILKEKYNIEVTHATYERTFLEQFYTKKQKGKHIGDIYGFPYVIGAWCNSRLKINPINKRISQIKKSTGKNIIQYVGIAVDEPERYNRLNHDTHIAPLYDLGITEQEALEICRENNLLSPIYESSFRGGCWFCPKQSLPQLKYLYENYPELWQELKRIEVDSHNTFKPNKTIEQLEEKFKQKK